MLLITVILRIFSPRIVVPCPGWLRTAPPSPSDRRRRTRITTYKACAVMRRVERFIMSSRMCSVMTIAKRTSLNASMSASGSHNRGCRLSPDFVISSSVFLLLRSISKYSSFSKELKHSRNAVVTSMRIFCAASMSSTAACVSPDELVLGLMVVAQIVA